MLNDFLKFNTKLIIIALNQLKKSVLIKRLNDTYDNGYIKALVII